MIGVPNAMSAVPEDWKADLRSHYGNGINRLLPYLLKALSVSWLTLCILLAGSALYNLFQIQSLRTETAHRRQVESQIETLLIRSTALRHLDQQINPATLEYRLARSGYANPKDLIQQLEAQIEQIQEADRDYGLGDWTSQLQVTLQKIGKAHGADRGKAPSTPSYSESISGLLEEWFSTAERLSQFGKSLSGIQEERSIELQRNNVLLAVAVLGFSLALVGLKLWQHARDSARHAIEMNSLHDEVRKDPLTGVLNRRGWDNLTQQQIRRLNKFGRTSISVAILDIDHFKLYNDSHGHDAGDRRLVEFAQLLKLNFRPCDLIARVGGEEFAILLPNCTVEDSQRIIDRIRNLSESKIPFSAGIASLEECRDLNEAMIVADDALYLAKNSGRNQCCIGHPQTLSAAPLL